MSFGQLLNHCLERKQRNVICVDVWKAKHFKDNMLKLLKWTWNKQRTQRKIKLLWPLFMFQRIKGNLERCWKRQHKLEWMWTEPIFVTKYYSSVIIILVTSKYVEWLQVLIIQDILHLSATGIENDQYWGMSAVCQVVSTVRRLATYPTADLFEFKPRLSYLPAVTLAHSPVVHIYSAFSENSTYPGKPNKLLHTALNSTWGMV